MFANLTRRLILSAAAALPLLMAAGIASSEAKELRVLAWQGYADDDWVKEFQEKSGAAVKVVFIGTDDEIWAKIKGSEGKDFDLFAVNTAQLQRYIDAGLTTPYDLDKLPNQKQTLPLFSDLTKVGGDTGIRLPPELTMLSKTLLNLDELGRVLDPDFNPNEAIQRNTAEIMRERMLKSVDEMNKTNVTEQIAKFEKLVASAPAEAQEEMKKQIEQMKASRVAADDMVALKELRAKYGDPVVEAMLAAVPTLNAQDQAFRAATK